MALQELKIGARYRTRNGSIVEVVSPFYTCGFTVKVIEGGHGQPDRSCGHSPEQLPNYVVSSDFSYGGGGHPEMDIIGPLRIPNKER